MSQTTMHLTACQDIDLAVVTPCEAQPCTDDTSKNRAYKELIINIAENLTSEDIDRLSFQQDLQNEFKTGMQLLRYLERRGRIGQQHLSALSDMLRTIHREDLVAKMIEPYQRKYDLSSNDNEEGVNLQAASSEFSAINLENTSTESMLIGKQQSGHKASVTSSSLHSSTHSLIQQETGDPSSSQQHFNVSASSEKLRNSYDYLYCSTPKSTHSLPHYAFTDEPKHYTKSQESSQCELNFTDYNNEITSSNSPSHRPYFTRNPPLGSSYSNSSPASEILWLGQGYSRHHSTSLEHFNHQPRAHKHIPKSLSFPHQPHPSPSMRKTASNSVVEKHRNYQQIIDSSSKSISQSSLNQQEQLSQFPKFSKTATPSDIKVHGECHDLGGTEYRGSLMSQVIQSASRVHDGRSVNETENQQPDLELIESASQSSGSETCMSPIQQLSGQPTSPVKEAPSALTSAHKVGDTCNLPSKSISTISKSVSQVASKFLKPLTKTSLKWPINRLKLNKTIYKHEVKSFECKKKLEVDIGNGASLNPKLSLVIHPCGLEKDIEAECATLVIYVNASKKAPPPEESASIILLIKVMESDGECELLNETACEINLNSRLVRKFGIVSHEALKKSESEYIDFEAKIAKCDI